MSRLPLGPVGIVGMPRSEVMLDPWNAHEIERGWSPLFTMQETWANEPSSITSRPNVSGRRCGGSGRNNYWYELEKRFEEELYVPFWTPISITTIYSQLDSLASDSCLV